MNFLVLSSLFCDQTDAFFSDTCADQMLKFTSSSLSFCARVLMTLVFVTSSNYQNRRIRFGFGHSFGHVNEYLNQSSLVF